MHGEHIVGGLVLFSLTKKVLAYGIARYYGFPRIYRKLVRINMAMNSSSPTQVKKMNKTVKNIFRFPNRIAALARRQSGTVSTEHSPISKP